MRAILVVMLAGCGGSPKSAALQPHNVGPAPSPSQLDKAAPPDEPTCALPEISAVPDTATAWGVVCDARTHDPIAGVTVVAGGVASITDTLGMFHFSLAPGDYKVAFYFGDCLVTGALHAASGHVAPRTQTIDSAGCPH